MLGLRDEFPFEQLKEQGGLISAEHRNFDSETVRKMNNMSVLVPQRISLILLLQPNNMGPPRPLPHDRKP